MPKASDNPFPSILVTETAAPADPSVGSQRLFIDPVDHILKRINSSGTVTPIGVSEITGLPTSETVTSKRLAPDGSGGVAWVAGGGGGGAVSADAIWDAKGDLAVGTGPDTAAKLAAGVDGRSPMYDSTASVGLSSAGSSALWEAAIAALSPVHWWKFSEASGNFTDAIASLVLTATATINYHTADPWGGTSAAEFTATGPSKGSATGIGSMPVGANARTILALVKAAAPTSNKSILAYGAASNGQYFMFQLCGSTIQGGDILDLWGYGNAITGLGPKIADGFWHLLAIGVVSGKMVALSIDGQVVEFNTNDTINTSNGSPYLVLNPDGADVFYADVAVFSSWLGKAKLSRLWDILRAAIG